MRVAQPCAVVCRYELPEGSPESLHQLFRCLLEVKPHRRITCPALWKDPWIADADGTPLEPITLTQTTTVVTEANIDVSPSPLFTPHDLWSPLSLCAAWSRASGCFIFFSQCGDTAVNLEGWSLTLCRLWVQMEVVKAVASTTGNPVDVCKQSVIRNRSVPLARSSLRSFRNDRTAHCVPNCLCPRCTDIFLTCGMAVQVRSALRGLPHAGATEGRRPCCAPLGRCRRQRPTGSHRRRRGPGRWCPEHHPQREQAGVSHGLPPQGVQANRVREQQRVEGQPEARPKGRRR